MLSSTKTLQCHYSSTKLFENIILYQTYGMVVLRERVLFFNPIINYYILMTVKKNITVLPIRNQHALLDEMIISWYVDSSFVRVNFVLHGSSVLWPPCNDSKLGFRILCVFRLLQILHAQNKSFFPCLKNISSSVSCWLRVKALDLKSSPAGG